jgi:hypothetical protein
MIVEKRKIRVVSCIPAHKFYADRINVQCKVPEKDPLAGNIYPFERYNDRIGKSFPLVLIHDIPWKRKIADSIKTALSFFA